MKKFVFLLLFLPFFGKSQNLQFLKGDEKAHEIVRFSPSYFDTIPCIYIEKGTSLDKIKEGYLVKKSIKCLYSESDKISKDDVFILSTEVLTAEKKKANDIFSFKEKTPSLIYNGGYKLLPNPNWSITPFGNGL